MQTFVVEVLDEKALPLLRNLENLDVIRLIPQVSKPNENPESNKDLERPSEQLWGAISPEVVADLHRQLEKMRNEWE